MAGKVLKIDVIVDENGHARRNLSELEGGVKKVESAATQLSPGVNKINALFADFDAKATKAEQSIGALGTEVVSVTSNFALLTGAFAAGFTAIGLVSSAVYVLGTYLKDSSELYIEHSGVLEINRGAVESLTRTWENLQFVVGEVVVGGDGDFREWVHLVEGGLLLIGTQLAADIEFYKTLGRLAKELVTGGNPGDPLGMPGIDTSLRDIDGALTPYGRLQEQRKRAQDPWRGGNDPLGLAVPVQDASLAESITMKLIADEKRAQLELEREQKKEAQERARFLAEHVKLENDLTQAIQRSKEAYDTEIAAAEKANAKRMESLSGSMKDSYLKSTLSEADYQKYAINAKADRAIGEVDPRADNAGALIRQYAAERELALIQLQQASEGFTQAVADDMNAFRIQYADVIGTMPTEFDAVIPPVLAASGAMRDGLTGDLAVVGSRTQQTAQQFELLANRVRGTHQQIAEGLDIADKGYRDAGFFIQQDANVSKLRSQQTGGLRFGLGGIVEAQYFGLGGPAGVDTVPAYLRPGEGVLSRTGMSALDRLNAGGAMGSRGGVTIEKGAVVIDARGAQFTDEASLNQLADKLQERIVAIGHALGG